MKQLKKFVSVLLALVMVLAMAIPVFAAGEYTITVKNTKESISIDGKEYSAYKLFDVTYNEAKTAYSYTVASEFEKFTYTASDGKTYSGDNLVAYVGKQQNNSAELDAIAKAALKYTEDNKIRAKGKATADGEQAVIQLNEAGYYLVTGEAQAKDETKTDVVAACSLTTTDPTAEVNVKADVPTVDKKIIEKDENGEETKVKNNNAAIGDTVQFEVTSKVPDMTGYEKYYFVVNDTLSKGLDFNDDITITIGGKTLTEETYYTEEDAKNGSIPADKEVGDVKQEGDYIVTTTKKDDGTTSIEIVFKNFIQYKDKKGQPIVITYSATVNNDAVIGTAGNKNEVTVTYSNDPNIKDDGTPGNPDKPKDGSPVGETPESETYTYVTDIKLIKVDPQGNRLTGAEFKLEGKKLNTVLVRTDVYTEDANGTYWKLKDGSYTTDDPDAEGMDRTKYESTTTKYTKTVQTTTVVKEENVTYTGTVGADGVLRFEGLSAGTYTITEIKAPDGYNLLKDPITVTIGFTAPTAPSTDCAWTYTWNTGTNGNNVKGSNNTVTIVNQTGSELPSTGGRGTTVFYVLGSILVIGAAILLVTKRRMNVER